MRTSCDDWKVALIHKDIIRLMMMKRKSTNKAVMADGFGKKENILKTKQFQPRPCSRTPLRSYQIMHTFNTNMLRAD